MCLQDSVLLMSKCTVREDRMVLLQDALRCWLWPLLVFLQKLFSVEENSSKIWRCFPKFVPCCCNISETKDVSNVLPSISVLQPCVRGLSTAQDVPLLWC